MVRVGRTPAFPDYIKTNASDRTLAIMVDFDVTLETGGVYTCTEYKEFIELITRKKLMVFIEDITSFVFISDAIYDEGCQVMSTKEGVPIAARFTVERRQSRWLVQSSTWDRKLEHNLMHDLRALYRTYGIVKPTPGSLGTSILRREWDKNPNLAKHTAPNAMCINFLRDHSVGGRCDTLVEPGYFIESALEIDAACSYLAHFLELPTGTSKKFIRGNVKDFATYFARCKVVVKQKLPLGPFPIRTENRRKKVKVSYPTEVGIYEAYLWKEQVQDCRDAGCTVTVYEGFGWEYTTQDTTSYCQYMYSKKQQEQFDPVEDMMKKTIVASIGSFGSKGVYYKLVPMEDAEDWEPVALDAFNEPTYYCVREEHNYLRPAMVHWFQYDLMQAARSLYHAALPYAKAGRLLMTNYDALLIIEKDETSKFPEKHTLESKMVELGDWRWQRLTGVTILGDRSLKCDQFVKRPGVPIDSEERSA